MNKSELRMLVKALLRVQGLPAASVEGVNISLNGVAKEAIGSKGFSRRDLRLQVVSELLGRRIKSTKDLSDQERAVLKELLGTGNYVDAVEGIKTLYKAVAEDMGMSEFSGTVFSVPYGTLDPEELELAYQKAGYITIPRESVVEVLAGANRREEKKRIDRIKRELAQKTREPDMETDPEANEKED